MTIINRDDLRSLAVPTVSQALTCLLLSLLILVLSNSDKLLRPFQAYLPASAVSSAVAVVLHDVAGLAGANTGVLVLFWATIGLTVYGICWVLLNVMAHTFNTVVIDTQFANRGSWLEQLSPGLLQAFFGAATVGFTLASGWLIAAIVDRFSNSLLTWSALALPLEAGLALGLALDIYTWWALLRLTFYVN